MDAKYYKYAVQSFKRTFGLNLAEFADKQLTTAHSFSLDYDKFALWYMANHDNWKGEMSLADAVAEEYGESASQLIDLLI